jgi:hypothetical protein
MPMQFNVYELAGCNKLPYFLCISSHYQTIQLTDSYNKLKQHLVNVSEPPLIGPTEAKFFCLQ